jgi:hypothetical protein
VFSSKDFDMIAGKNEIMFANAGVLARWGWSELLTKRAELDSAQTCKDISGSSRARA